MIGKIIDLSKITDPRGNLTVAEQYKDIPFEIKRVYWTYDVPGGETRGGHAHKKLYQLVVATSGSFIVTLDNGKEKEHPGIERHGFYPSTKRRAMGSQVHHSGRAAAVCLCPDGEGSHRQTARTTAHAGQRRMAGAVKDDGQRMAGHLGRGLLHPHNSQHSRHL